MKSIKQIIDAVAKRDANKHITMQGRQRQLRNLVEKFGEERVYIAGGWSAATLKQYLTTTTPSISLDKLMQAKDILEG